MTDIDGLTKVLKDHKAALEKDYGVSEIGIFGSYVEGRQGERSDIDILVEFKNAVDLFLFVHLKNHLSDLLGDNVDLVMKRALKPNIGKRVLRQVVYV